MRLPEFLFVIAHPQTGAHGAGSSSFSPTVGLTTPVQLVGCCGRPHCTRSNIGKFPRTYCNHPGVSNYRQQPQTSERNSNQPQILEAAPVLQVPRRRPFAKSWFQSTQTEYRAIAAAINCGLCIAHQFVSQDIATGSFSNSMCLGCVSSITQPIFLTALGTCFTDESYYAGQGCGACAVLPHEQVLETTSKPEDCVRCDCSHAAELIGVLSACALVEPHSTIYTDCRVLTDVFNEHVPAKKLRRHDREVIRCIQVFTGPEISQPQVCARALR